MKIATAKMLFNEGVLIKAVATNAPLSNGYLLQLSKASTPEKGEIMVTDKGDARVFKTADALLKTARDIGFKNVTFTN